MRKFFSLMVAAALALASLALVPGARSYAATGRISLDVAGQKRESLLTEYERLKRKPRTTIIVLRSAGPRARTQSTDRRGIGIVPIIRNAGVVVAYPEAVNGKWNLGGDGPDDVAFIRALAAKLVADGVADKRKIFIAGVSTGGLLALKIACEGAEYVNGIAVMISALPAGQAASCKIAKPTAFLLVNGTADPLLPFQGGKANLGNFNEEVVSSEATLAPFLSAARCGTDHTSQEMPDRDPNDGSRVSLLRYSGCASIIEFVRVDGGGHTLPGRPARGERGSVVGATNNDISTPRVLWDFVRRAAR